MRCPFCDHIDDKVIDSRQSKDGDVIRRRRECLKCEGRFTSYERIEARRGDKSNTGGDGLGYGPGG